MNAPRQLSRRSIFQSAGVSALVGLCKSMARAPRQQGALFDELLLAAIYVELLGERQATFGVRPLVTNERGPEKPVGAAFDPTLSQFLAKTRLLLRSWEAF
jgi:hypothetical protein